MHRIAVESIAGLLEADEPAFFTPQNVAEFWNVATRPNVNNGLGLSVSQTLAEVTKFERFLTLLPDSSAVYPEWRRLVSTHAVTGVKVHDARLVAAMNVHRISRLLTFNVSDFARYAVETLDPVRLASCAMNQGRTVET